jgi:hypothetical protein
MYRDRTCERDRDRVYESQLPNKYKKSVSHKYVNISEQAQNKLLTWKVFFLHCICETKMMLI